MNVWNWTCQHFNIRFW